jgi:hypothetical protein
MYESFNYNQKILYLFPIRQVYLNRLQIHQLILSGSSVFDYNVATFGYICFLIPTELCINKIVKKWN